MMLLHGEQYTEILAPPLPTSADIVTEGTINGIYDKGKGALVTIEFISSDKEDEEAALEERDERVHSRRRWVRWRRESRRSPVTIRRIARRTWSLNRRR